MGATWGGGTQMANIMKMPILWVKQGNNLGKTRWETCKCLYGLLLGQPGCTQMGSKYERPYGSSIGQTCGTANGKYIKVSIWANYGNNLGKPLWENVLVPKYGFIIG